MKKTVLILMALTIVSKLLGFSRDFTLAYFYGASSISDVYLVSLVVPGLLFGFVAAGISTGYIPMYSKIDHQDGSTEGMDFTNNLLNILFLLCTVIMAIGMIFTEPIIKVFASGFEGETLSNAILFTRISLISIYFTSISYILSGYLELKNSFAISAYTGLPFNFFVILFIYMSYKIDFRLLAIGFVLAKFSQALILLIFAYKKGFAYKPKFNIKDEKIKKMIILAIPVILGASVTQVNVLVDQTIASRIAVGGISALNYASTLNTFVLGVFVLTVITVMYPTISKMASQNNMVQLKDVLSKSINSILLLVIPASIGSMVLAKPIVVFLFGRGAFGDEAISLTTLAFFFYSLGLMGFGLREVLSKVFYSLQDTKTPMINAAFAMTLNIILNLILSRYLGIGGLALATSISAIFCSVLLMYSLRKKIGSYGMKDMTKSFAKILTASMIMGIFSKVLYGFLITTVGLTISLLISVSLSVVVYALIISFMKIEVVDLFLGELKKKLINVNKIDPPNSNLRKKA